ncbi:hypothetical protein LguiA_024242 [Lonicera macranthoides]
MLVFLDETGTFTKTNPHNQPTKQPTPTKHVFSNIVPLRLFYNNVLSCLVLQQEPMVNILSYFHCPF